MAEPLVNQFGPEIPRKLADMLAAVVPGFDADAFVADALFGLGELSLMARGQHLAEVMRRHLPVDDAQAFVCVGRAIEQPVDLGEGSLASFLYLPYTCWVATYGLNQFEAAMRLQHRLTQLFTAEFSIRAFLAHAPEATLARLNDWATDPNEHVRRLVSEGTRPRLPWGRRLRAFQHDPAPVLALLDKLKDDPSAYVRRSVANNLNDIGKDHPHLLVQTARRWLSEPTETRTPQQVQNLRDLVSHALRSLVKAGHAEALAVLGYGAQAQVSIDQVSCAPAHAVVGGTVTIGCRVNNGLPVPQRLLCDLVVHYCKANGTTRPKVFKLKQVVLGAGATVVLSKTLSLQQMTTRTHHPGEHRVELLVNGAVHPLGSFVLRT